MISFSLSENFITLLISRILIGIGVGACLMGPLTAYRIWYQDETQQRANSWMLMVGAIGMLSSSLPVQFFLPIIGWRMIFITLALLTIFCIILIIFFIPNWNKANIQSNSKDNGSLKEIWNNQNYVFSRKMFSSIEAIDQVPLPCKACKYFLNKTCPQFTGN